MRHGLNKPTGRIPQVALGAVLIVALLAAFVVASPPAIAQQQLPFPECLDMDGQGTSATKVWINEAGGDWANDNNWEPKGQPKAEDRVCIPDLANPGVVDVFVTTPAQGVTITQLRNMESLTLTSATVTNIIGAELSRNDGVLIMPRPLFVTSPLGMLNSDSRGGQATTTWTSTAAQFSGVLNNTAGSLLQNDAGSPFGIRAGSTVINDGTMRVTDADIFLGNDTTLKNNGLLDIVPVGIHQLNGGTRPPVITNTEAGEILVRDGGTFTFQTTTSLEDAGGLIRAGEKTTLRLLSSEIALTNTDFDAGQDGLIEATAGSIVTLSGTIGTPDVSGTGMVLWNRGTNVGSGLVTFDFPEPGAGTHLVVNSTRNAFVRFDGEWLNDGHLTMAANDSAGIQINNDGKFTNQGTFEFTGSGDVLSDTGANGTFANIGTIVVDNGGVEAEIGRNVAETFTFVDEGGTINVQSGSLNLDAQVMNIQDTTFFVHQDGVVNFETDSLDTFAGTLAGGTSSGGGLVRLSGNSISTSGVVLDFPGQGDRTDGVIDIELSGSGGTIQGGWLVPQGVALRMTCASFCNYSGASGLALAIDGDLLLLNVLDVTQGANMILNADTGAQIRSIATGNPELRLTDTGTLNVVGTGTATIDAATQFNPSNGTLNVASGTLQVNETSTITPGAFNVGPGALVDLPAAMQLRTTSTLSFGINGDGTTTDSYGRIALGGQLQQDSGSLGSLLAVETGAGATGSEYPVISYPSTAVTALDFATTSLPVGYGHQIEPTQLLILQVAPTIPAACTNISFAGNDANVWWVGGNGSWDDSANWNTSTVPTAGDVVCISVDGADVVVTAPTNVSIGQLLLDETLLTTAGNFFEVRGGISRVEPNGKIELPGDVILFLDSDASLSNRGEIIFNCGSNSSIEGSTLSNSGVISHEAGCTNGSGGTNVIDVDTLLNFDTIRANYGTIQIGATGSDELRFLDGRLEVAAPTTVPNSLVINGDLQLGSSTFVVVETNGTNDTFGTLVINGRLLGGGIFSAPSIGGDADPTDQYDIGRAASVVAEFDIVDTIVSPLSLFYIDQQQPFPQVILSLQGAGPGNEEPVANNDEVTIDEDTIAADIDVLDNDTDVNDDIDPDSIEIVTGPLRGQVNIRGGSIAYTPNQDFFGTDSFTYTVNDNAGATSNTATVTIIVEPVNDAPVFQMPPTLITDEDVAVSFDLARLGGDLENDPITYTVDPDPLGGVATADNGIVVYTPNPDFNGFDAFIVIADDGNGGVTPVQFGVVINPVNDAPVANDDPNAEADEDTAVDIDVLANDTDVDSQGLQPGDGIDPGSVVVTSGPTNGQVTITSTGLITYTPGLNFFGTDTLTYTVEDSAGVVSNEATVTITIAPVNDAPTVQTPIQLATDQNTDASIDVLALADDVDGDTLVISDPGSPTNGSLSGAGGVVTYSPNTGFNGTDEFTVTVIDGNGGEALATVNVSVIAPGNAAPVANDDPEAQTNEDAAVDIDVLFNDTDIDDGIDTGSIMIVTDPTNGTASVIGGEITYTPAQDFFGTDSLTYTVNDNAGAPSNPATVTITVDPVNDAPTLPPTIDETTNEDTAVDIDVVGTANDVDGDPLTITDLGTPANGIVTETGDVVTYIPDPDFFGTDTFIVTITDGNLTAETTITVTIEPVNDAPVANDDPNAATDEDTAVDIDVLANDTDIDGDDLQITSATNGTNGTVTIVNGMLTYTPDPDFFGTDSFVYTIADMVGPTDSATVAVTVASVNDAPTLPANIALATTEDTAVDVDIVALASDVDGDTLLIDSVGTPDNGSATQAGDIVTYTPATGFTGTDTFTVTVTDPLGLSAETMVTVIVDGVNQAPVANDDPDVTADEDGSVDIDVLINDTDPNGDPLVITSATDGTNGTVAIVNGMLTYTPDPNFNGIDSFVYTIADMFGPTDSATVTVTVTPVNDAPTVEPTPGLPANADVAETTTAGVPVTVDIVTLAEDIDGDTLTIDSFSQPTNGTAAVLPSGLLQYTPGAGFLGVDTFDATVTDSNGGTVSVAVSVLVNAVPVFTPRVRVFLPPVFSNPTPTATPEPDDQVAEDPTATPTPEPTPTPDPAPAQTPDSETPPTPTPDPAPTAEPTPADPTPVPAPTSEAPPEDEVEGETASAPDLSAPEPSAPEPSAPEPSAPDPSDNEPSDTGPSDTDPGPQDAGGVFIGENISFPLPAQGCQAGGEVTVGTTTTTFDGRQTAVNVSTDGLGIGEHIALVTCSNADEVLQSTLFAIVQPTTGTGPGSTVVLLLLFLMLAVVALPSANGGTQRDQRESL